MADKGTDKGVTLTPVGAASKKSKLQLILMVLVVIMTGAAGFLGWKYFTSTRTAAAPAKTSEAAEGAPEAEAEGEAAEAEAEEAPAEGEHGEQAAPSSVINFEPFLVNLADADAFRYLRVTIRVQVTKGAATGIAANEVLNSQMRDVILGALSTKIATEIVQPEGKEKLKTEIKDKLNAFLPKKPVKAVFFIDFVVQL